MKILLIEDHPIVRAGCRRLLAERPDLEILEAETGAAGLAAAADHQPDLVVLDLNLPDARGMDILRTLRERKPEVKVLVFSMYEEPAFVSTAMEAGARAYVSKNDDPDSLIEAIDAVAAGGVYMGRSVAQKLALAKVSGDPLAGLSERERELLALLGAGQTLAEIAAALQVSYRTAAEQAARLRVRLGLRTNTALVKYAVDAGAAR